MTDSSIGGTWDELELADVRAGKSSTGIGWFPSCGGDQRCGG
jgi:hypothetical protein